MTGPLLIGIGGRLASGKDTIADRLVDKYGFRKHWMSEALNDAMLKLNPVIGVDFDGYKVRYSRQVIEAGYTEAKNHPEVRRLLQVFGTEIGRKMFGENTWADLVARKIDDSRFIDHVPVVVTGIRFRNELTMIKARGGLTVWVERPDLENTSAHESETTLTGASFDFKVVNDGSIEDLYANLADWLPTWSAWNLLRGQPDSFFRGSAWPVYDN